MNDSPKVGDLFGVAPLGRAVERVTDSAMSGLENVLSRVCLPAAEEFGLAMRDRVSEWRRRNAAATLQLAKPMLEAAASEGRHAPPRLVMGILDQACSAETTLVQGLWAGLLASSCTQNADDDSNWIFINILAQLTAMEATLLKAACEGSPKHASKEGLIFCDKHSQTVDELIQLTGCRDVDRLDREMDHLRVLGLIEGGFQILGGPTAYITATALALHLYVRCQGSLASPVDYFGVRPIEAATQSTVVAEATSPSVLPPGAATG